MQCINLDLQYTFVRMFVVGVTTMSQSIETKSLTNLISQFVQTMQHYHTHFVDNLVLRFIISNIVTPNSMCVLSAYLEFHLYVCIMAMFPEIIRLNFIFLYFFQTSMSQYFQRGIENIHKCVQFHKMMYSVRIPFERQRTKEI